MIEACSSCGYTVDPNCDVCKGVGEYNACATVPLATAVRVASDDTVQKCKIRAGGQVIDEDTAIVMEALDFGQFSADMLCGVLAGGAARGIAKSTQQALSRYLQRQYDALYADHANPTHAQAAAASPAEGTNKAIDLIGCALVALKANVPLYRSPQVLLGLRKKSEGFNLWVLPGGTHENNESPEECVRRETREEIGVSRLIGLRSVSFAYNSDNPDRKYLMLYYTAYIAGEEPRIVAEHEFSDLQWFDVDMLPSEMWQTDRDAIANTLMMRPK